ncbi:MAG: metallophosphoesterase [Isosphaeraceae bacterium]
MIRSRSSFAFGLLALLALGGALEARGAAEPGRFLVISDLHFDPFFDPDLFEPLRTQPVERWAEILKGSRPAGFNPRGTDSNHALVASALDDARARSPSPDFVLYPGDFLAHDWAARYDKLAPKSHTDDPVAYRAFTDKTIRFLSGEFARRFPNTPILPTLGNEDSYCGDYQIEPDGPFLAAFADAWAPLLGPGVDRAAFRETFRRGGYYALALPRARGCRLVVLNSVFFSVNYDDACGRASQTPALDQFRWLDHTLGEAREAGDSVWLLMHVPPGINSYNASRSVPEGKAPDTFWQPELTSRFLELIGRYRSTVRLAFAGHTHMDDFRSVPVDGAPALFVKIVPAVSPIFGNNPGYQIYDYDPVKGTLEDYRTFSLPLPGPGGAGVWGQEYEFQTTYGPRVLDAPGVTDLASALKAIPALREAYTRDYGVGAPAEFPPSAFEYYRLAIANVTPAEYLRGLVGVPRPSPMRPDRRTPRAVSGAVVP